MTSYCIKLPSLSAFHELKGSHKGREGSCMNVIATLQTLISCIKWELSLLIKRLIITYARTVEADVGNEYL